MFRKILCFLGIHDYHIQKDKTNAEWTVNGMKYTHQVKCDRCDKVSKKVVDKTKYRDWRS